MFLQFQKISNTSASSLIIVNAQELLRIDFNNFEMGGEISNQTHVEIGNPKFQFYTLSTISNIEIALNVINISGGYVPGDPCSGGNATTVIAPASSFPLIQIPVISNNNLSDPTTLSILNPTKILYVDTVTFIDSISGAQVSATQIIMTDMNRSKLVTNLMNSS